MEELSKNIIINNILLEDKEKLKSNIQDVLDINLNNIQNLLIKSINDSIDIRLKNFYSSDFDYDKILFDQEFKISEIDEVIKEVLKIKNSNIHNLFLQKIQTEKLEKLNKNSKKHNMFQIIKYDKDHQGLNRSTYTYYFCKEFIVEKYDNHSSYGSIPRYTYFDNKFSNSMLFIFKQFEIFYCSNHNSFSNFYSFFEKNPNYLVDNCAKLEILSKKQKEEHEDKIKELDDKIKDTELVKDKFKEKKNYYLELENNKNFIEEEKNRLFIIREKLKEVKEQFQKEKEEYQKEKEQFQKEKEEFERKKNKKIDIDSFFE